VLKDHLVERDAGGALGADAAPLPTSASPGEATPCWMVSPWKVTVNGVVFWAPGLMSKTRLRPPPSTVIAPPLVFTMLRLWLAV
jgi:hypothetical protein